MPASLPLVWGQESLHADKAILCVCTQCINPVFMQVTKTKCGGTGWGAGAQQYLQQLYGIGLLADAPDLVGETVHAIYLLFARFDLLPVCLEG